MIIERLRSEKFISDDHFDSIYPPRIQSLSGRHWTPVMVAKMAAEFLCQKKGAKVLDIGSGPGKFCLTGAALHQDCTFHGVDYRKDMIDISNRLKRKYKVENVAFLHMDILDMSLDGYDSVYFFNSFHEKIDVSAAIDRDSSVSYELYCKYTAKLFLKLDQMPLDTKIVTYYTSESCVPDSYQMVGCHLFSRLKCYVKVANKCTGWNFTEEDNDSLHQ